MRNHVRDSSGVFSISTLVKMMMTSLISCLTLKLYLNFLMYDLSISDRPRKFSAIFGYLRKFSKNQLETSLCQFWEIFGNLREIVKMSISVCLYNNAWLLVGMEYFFSCSTLYLTHSLCSLVRYRVERSKGIPYLREPMCYPLYISQEKTKTHRHSSL